MLKRRYGIDHGKRRTFRHGPWGLRRGRADTVHEGRDSEAVASPRSELAGPHLRLERAGICTVQARGRGRRGTPGLTFFPGQGVLRARSSPGSPRPGAGGGPGAHSTQQPGRPASDLGSLGLWRQAPA